MIFFEKWKTVCFVSGAQKFYNFRQKTNITLNEIWNLNFFTNKPG